MPVIICFNKIDLSGGKEIEELRAIYGPAGYTLHFISTYEAAGLEKLHELIAGKTTVLAGPSGVGKSSITNFLQPEARMETGVVSEKIKRGKHTTRHSELFFVENGTYMMDTPGFSSMYIEDLEPNELKDYFPEFSEYEEECRFLGCIHVGEKVCGVKTAVADGKISRSRYDNYLLLYQEYERQEEILIMIILAPSILGADFETARRAGTGGGQSRSALYPSGYNGRNFCPQYFIRHAFD